MDFNNSIVIFRNLKSQGEWLFIISCRIGDSNNANLLRTKVCLYTHTCRMPSLKDWIRFIFVLFQQDVRARSELTYFLVSKQILKLMASPQVKYKTLFISWRRHISLLGMTSHTHTHTIIWPPVIILVVVVSYSFCVNISIIKDDIINPRGPDMSGKGVFVL